MTDHKKKTKGNKNRLLRSTPLLIALCIVLAVITIILVYLIRNHVEAKRGAQEQLRLSAIAGFDCEYTEAQQLYPFQNGLLKVTNTRVAYLSISGNEIYSVDLEMSNPSCIFNGPYALIADTEGFFCAMFSEEGMIYSTHMTGKIGSLALASSGLAALIIEDGDSFGCVYMLDRDGSFLAKWSSYESGYPLSLEFSPDESTLSVALVDTDGSQMIPHMKMFAMPKDSSVDHPKECASFDPSVSSIMPLMAYLSNDKVALAGIDAVTILGDGKCEKVEPAFPCVYSIFSFDGGYGVLYADGIDQPIRLATYDQQASKIGEVSLGNEVLHYDISGSQALIAVDMNIYVIDLSSASVSSTIPVDETIIRVSFFGTKNICVVTNEGVREISI